jgi:hypothetical protein
MPTNDDSDDRTISSIFGKINADFENDGCDMSHSSHKLFSGAIA